MKYLLRLLVLLILLPTLWLVQIQSQSSGTLPELPLEELSTQLIFPFELIQSDITQDQSLRTYLFPALSGEEIELVMNRLEGDLVPLMRLRTTSGAIITEETAQDLAGQRVRIDYEVPQDSWFLVDVSFDPASDESYGTFELRLMGTTTILYDFTASGEPPNLDDVLYFTRGMLQPIEVDGAMNILLSLNPDETLTVIGEGTLTVTNLANEDVLIEVRDIADEIEVNTTESAWLLLSLDAESGTLIILNISANEDPDATLAAYQLGDLITPSPSPTATNTPLPTSTPRPTATRRPTATPIHCPGTLIARLEVGDTARVIPGPSNNMRAEPGLNATRFNQQIPGGGRFTVLNGPVCADNFTWYQVDYAGVIGWTAEANTNEYWIEPVQ